MGCVSLEVWRMVTHAKRLSAVLGCYEERRCAECSVSGVI
jgi:hypothetical protein